MIMTRVAQVGDRPRLSFVLNSSRISWSDGGRQEIKQYQDLLAWFAPLNAKGHVNATLALSGVESTPPVTNEIEVCCRRLQPGLLNEMGEAEQKQRKRESDEYRPTLSQPALQYAGLYALLSSVEWCNVVDE